MKEQGRRDPAGPSSLANPFVRPLDLASVGKPDAGGLRRFVEAAPGTVGKLNHRAAATL